MLFNIEPRVWVFRVELLDTQFSRFCVIVEAIYVLPGYVRVETGRVHVLTHLERYHDYAQALFHEVDS